jgi:hypothetical protein
MDFTSSRAAQGYNPQFLNTDTLPGMPSASSASAPDLTNRLLQVLSGQLGGTLTGGEKLSALGALLKSVSRGSQTSPQQVMQSIQQQKLQQVQGALQIQELRKAAAEKAQREGFIAQASSRITDPAERDFFMSLTDKGKEEYLIKKMAPDTQLSSYGRRIVESFGVKPGSDAFKALSAYQIGMPTTEVTPTGTTTYAGLRPYATSYDAAGKKFIKMEENGPWLSAE